MEMFPGLCGSHVSDRYDGLSFVQLSPTPLKYILVSGATVLGGGLVASGPLWVELEKHINDCLLENVTHRLSFFCVSNKSSKLNRLVPQTTRGARGILPDTVTAFNFYFGWDPTAELPCSYKPSAWMLARSRLLSHSVTTSRHIPALIPSHSQIDLAHALPSWCWWTTRLPVTSDFSQITPVHNFYLSKTINNLFDVFT